LIARHVIDSMDFQAQSISIVDFEPNRALEDLVSSITVGKRGNSAAVDSDRVGLAGEGNG
jgi:hypothetical protein